jgi:hypothetical protein
MEQTSMNERIKKLAEQAGSTHKQSLGVYQFYSYELEKFAELIIKETLQIARVGMEFGPSMDEAVYTYFRIEE